MEFDNIKESDDMRTFKFMMTFDNTIVAEGTASATMLSGFQRDFAETIGGGANQEFTEDGFQSVMALLMLPVGDVKAWNAVSPDGKEFRFWCQRLA